MRRLARRISSQSKSLDKEFLYYGRKIRLTTDATDTQIVEIYDSTDPYGEIVTKFTFDFKTHELKVKKVESPSVLDAILDTFVEIHPDLKADNLPILFIQLR